MTQERLMGFQSANAGFLAAYFASLAPGEPVHCYARSAEDFENFRRRATLAGLSATTPITHIPFPELARLGEPGCLYLAAPVLGPSAWVRRRVGNRSYSLCGVNYTLSTPRVMDALVDLLIAPVQPWDALVCTCVAIKVVVERVLEEMAEYLAQRTGARPPMPVMLPLIPLGVDVAAYQPHDAAGRRQTFRARHGIAEDDVAVLFLGRLSAHSKAHPTPMFRALERAAALSGRRFVLILAGWFYNDATRDGFAAAATAFMPSVRMIVLDGRAAEVKASVWHGVDVFTSLSDNIQESFGLTPIEAMAAGLPVVASDWDGYRDTVADGETGLLVPTAMPPAGAGEDLALATALDVDDHEVHIARTSQCIVVDIDAAARAYARLALEPELRRRMGAAGRRRAAELYDWRVVVARYRELWAEQAERRAGAPALAPSSGAGASWPARDDPFARFAPFATAAIGPGTRISAADADPVQALRRLAGLPLSVFDPSMLPAAEAVVRQVAGAERVLVLDGSGSRAEGAERALTFRAIAWLAKLGVVRIHR
jgi:glycosyltransferase involved in cell wall biosynthesis